MFDKKIYQQRRNKLSRQVKSGLLLFLSNDESPMNYPANTYHYRQDSTFLYFFGLSFPGLAAVIDIDEDRQTVFGNDLDMDDIIWMGPQPSLKSRCAKIGISDTRPLAELGAVLQDGRAPGPQDPFPPPTAPRTPCGWKSCWASAPRRSRITPRSNSSRPWSPSAR